MKLSQYLAQVDNHHINFVKVCKLIQLSNFILKSIQSLFSDVQPQDPRLSN